MIIVLNDDLRLRALELSDSNTLVRWLSDPEVLSYYEGRDRLHDSALVREHFFDHQDEMSSYIMEYKGTDIGYIQIYPLDEEKAQIYGYQGHSAGLYGMDQFIGETEYWNQGIGSQLITAVVKHLVEKRGASKIVLDPQAWNTRAIRVYEKCGFTKKKYLEKHELHEGELRDCWLMEYVKP